MAGKSIFTAGVLRALYKSRHRTVCPGCGFPMPVYPGRYPKGCPGCGMPRLKNDENPGDPYDREPANRVGGRGMIPQGIRADFAT